MVEDAGEQSQMLQRYLEIVEKVLEQERIGINDEGFASATHIDRFLERRKNGLDAVTPSDKCPELTVRDFTVVLYYE
ncbi:hypothetical protein DMJ13_20975 [halophilic archaeon]|nr:hypothetical protein DMJ13_20975 [halophilic archaeon]